MPLNADRVIGLAIILLLGILSSTAVAEDSPVEAGRLTLQEAVEIALSHHPRLLAARGNLQFQQALVGEARSNYFPQLNAQGNYTRATANTSTSVQSSQAFSQPGQSLNQSLSRGPSNTSFNNYAATLTLQQRIFDFGKTVADVESARETMQGSDLTEMDTRQSVTVNTKVAYFGLLQARRLVQVQEETVKQFKEHLDQAQGFFQAGTRTRYDVTTAEDGARALALLEAAFAVGAPRLEPLLHLTLGLVRAVFLSMTQIVLLISGGALLGALGGLLARGRVAA